jgi:ferredoxin
MPLTHRGREILNRVPGGALLSTTGVGCEIVRHEELCVGCGTCASNCPSGASTRSDRFDARQLLDAPPGSRRGALGDALRRIMRHEPAGPVEVPPRVVVLRTIAYDDELCLGCGTCARTCPTEAIEARPPQAAAAPSASAAGVSHAPSSAAPADTDGRAAHEGVRA